MSDPKIGLDGRRGPRGERGERGERGHRGHDGGYGATGPTGSAGATGSTGSTGSTGATGPGQETAVGQFRPDALISAVVITSQNGLFASAAYNAVGDYLLTLVPIPGLIAAEQLVPVATAFLTAGTIITLLPGFSGGQGKISVQITDAAGVPIDRSFSVISALLI